MSATRLRGPLTASDVDGLLDDVMSWVNDPDVTKNLARFDGKISREEEREFLLRHFASPTDRVFSIEDEGGGYIGQIGIHQIYWPARNGRLGIVIGKRSEWGRGHASRAIEQLVPLAFEQLGLNKIWAIFYTTNLRMRHITEKLGFVQEGVLLEEYYHREEFHDMVRVCLLRRHWNERRENRS